MVSLPLMVWDTAWKLVAVRRAWQLRDYGWIAGITVISSVGVLPMFYLWRNRGREPGGAGPMDDTLPAL
jgi:hypothetical protein